tara:strand:+ start:1815 stop:2732 length:918 start_codon:yes stop_codon:yes gene_type:complete
MNKNNSSIMQFIEDLKKIDVSELLEKARTINIEDIKSLNLEDLKKISKSRAFYPTIGILLASLFTVFGLLPSYKALKDKHNLSNRYTNEKNELPSIENLLDKKSKTKSEIDIKFPLLKNLVADSESLFLLTELLDDSAKRTSVEISAIEPLSEEDLNSCSSSPEEELFGDGFNPQNQNYDGGLDNQDDFAFDEQLPFEEDLPLDQPTQIYNFNPETNAGLGNFNIIPKDIGNGFKSNNYSLQIKSNYINVLNFLRTIQEYKMIVIPVCFEPRLTSPTFSGFEQGPITSTGEVDARLIINIPTISQ